MRIGFAKPCRRADLVEAARNFKAREFSRIRDRRIDLRQIEGRRRASGQHLGGQDAKAVIDVTHVGRRRTLIIPNHARTVEQDVAGVPKPIVAKDRHQGRRTAAAERDQRRQVGNVKVTVAIKHEELLAQLGKGLTNPRSRVVFDSSTSPTKSRTIPPRWPTHSTTRSTPSRRSSRS